MKKWNMREIVGNSEEYFWGLRENGAEFLGTGELKKSEFRGTPKYIFQEQGNNCKFLQGTREHATPPPPPTPLGGPHKWLLVSVDVRGERTSDEALRRPCVGGYFQLGIKGY